MSGTFGRFGAQVLSCPRGPQLSTTSATYPWSRNQRDHSWFDSDTPWQPCSRMTAGNGPGPWGRSRHAGTVSGLPGVAFGKARLVVAQPAMTVEARSADSARRTMGRAYTGPQREAKREPLRGVRVRGERLRRARRPGPGRPARGQRSMGEVRRAAPTRSTAIARETVVSRSEERSSMTSPQADYVPVS